MMTASNTAGGFIIAGANYGQGSSREHAALAPMYLGIKAVIAKSFARIHRANLINFGIIPFTFCNEEDYDTIDELDELTITNFEIPCGAYTGGGNEYHEKQKLSGFP